MKRLVLAAMLFAAPVSAIAQTASAPHTIDMTVVLMDQHNKPIPDPTQASADDPKCEKCGPLTLGAAVATALLAEHRDEQGISAIDKAKRAALALRVMDNKAAALTAKETADITRLMSLWGALVVMRALPLLDPNVDLTDR